MTDIRFPADFLFGAATAAYQIEGAASDDGRTPSIWDTFSHTPGRTVEGHTGDVACDHYHRLAGDLDLIGDLGLSAYRFSVSWPRVLPGGARTPNPAGLDFYNRLVDGLLERGVEPWLTLYHWDLPQELEDAGGWPVRATADRFTEYALAMHEALGDRVTRWTTFNEPWCSAFLGYASGDHAPGRTEPARSVEAAHHLLLAHGLGVGVLRPNPVSLVVNPTSVRPVSAAEPDVAAARRVDGIINRLFLDPVLRGSYPADVLAATAALVDWDSLVRDGDLAIIGAPIDVLGVNYYQPALVGHSDVPLAAPNPWPGCERVAFHPVPAPVTAMGWAVDPTGLRDLLLRIHADYGDVPIMVTENGAAYEDRVVDGAVADAERIEYLRGHLAAAHEALRAGVDLRGYFVWSLLDNFEWAFGYSQRFGLIHVDYRTQARTLKASAYWYRDVIAQGGL